MPTGRPLGLATIKSHLTAVASDLPTGNDRDMLMAISTHLGQKNFMRPDTLHDVVLDLDAFVGRSREFLGGDTIAYTNRCIDAIAKMEDKARLVMTKANANSKAPTKKMMGAYAPKEAKPVVVKPTVSAIEAIVEAMKVLLDEVASGHDDIDTFDSLRDLTNVLERIV